MPLATRIIPTLLMRDGHLVKGQRYDSMRVVGNAQQAVEIHQARGIDELIVLDVGATPAARGPDIDVMRKLTERCFVPVAVGGGVSTLEHIRLLLANGADKVVIGTQAVNSLRFVQLAAQTFGRQAIVVAVDAVRVQQGWRVVSQCGKCVHPSLTMKRFVAGVGQHAGELIVTNVERDGTLQGYDLPLVRAVARAVDIPVIASGGCGTYEHMRQALRAGAHAVAAGAMFQWTDATPRGAAQYLSRHGIVVRL